MSESKMLSHMVYFTLADSSPEACERLVERMRYYLTNHDGTVFFAAGTLVKDLNRPVNDLDFHVSLHVVFDSRAAHDTYQTHERHLQYIDENKGNWTKVRVFDSYVD
ncbi:MAG: Dabb family protein [Planctomycetota bacterium]|nr:Dabb family protein [Planctomycetota bacterium]